MFAAIESFWHRIRRRLSRNEWAVRHLGLSPCQGTSEEPGLLLIQIDGLPRRQLESAMAAGRMPFLRRLRDNGRYPLHTFYSGLPSTTPAVQGELYYGIRTGVPAFSFLDRERGDHLRSGGVDAVGIGMVAVFTALGVSSSAIVVVGCGSLARG